MGPAPVNVVGKHEPAPSRAEVRDLYSRAFSGPPANEGAAEADLFSGLYERTVEQPETIVATSRDGDGLVGICYGRPWHWNEQTDSWAEEVRERLPAESVAFLDHAFAIYLLAVEPDRQRAGLGAALLTTVLSESRCDRAWLMTTDVESPAVSFYRDRGWHLLGHGADAPDGRPGLVLGWRRGTSGR